MASTPISRPPARQGLSCVLDASYLAVVQRWLVVRGEYGEAIASMTLQMSVTVQTSTTGEAQTRYFDVAIVCAPAILGYSPVSQ